MSLIFGDREVEDTEELLELLEERNVAGRRLELTAVRDEGKRRGTGWGQGGAHLLVGLNDMNDMSYIWAYLGPNYIQLVVFNHGDGR